MKTNELSALCNLLHEKHMFAVGDIVEWKPGLKNKRATGPFVVEQVYEKPVVNPAGEAGSTYFKEPLDIVLGHVDDDGDFMLYHYDSRRFQPVK